MTIKNSCIKSVEDEHTLKDNRSYDDRVIEGVVAAVIIFFFGVVFGFILAYLTTKGV